MDPSVDSVTMPYHLAFDEYGNVSFSLRRNRLVKRERNFLWHGAVHEYLEVTGKVINSDIAIIHKGHGGSGRRNLEIYQMKLERGEPFSPRDLYYYGNELFDHGCYEEAAKVYEEFLATGLGWVEDCLVCCGKLADCYHELGDGAKAVTSVLHALSYDRPRPEICCRLGYHFLEKGDYSSAIFWYQAAITNKGNEEGLGFCNRACSTWLPHLQLCVCYSKMGDHQLAYKHNEIALRYRPRDPIINQNKEILGALLED